MRAIDRKLLRDLWQTRGQVTAISLVIGCGIAIFVLSLTTIASLENTLATYYERYRFAEVFAGLKRAPDSLARQIAAIPGVAQVETRVVENVTLDVAGLAEPAAGMLISIPEVRRPILNDLYLRNGRWPEPGRADEVLASEGFTNAHGFGPGDSFEAIIIGRKQSLRIVGVALSPEHIYSIRAGDI
ncbi:MAG: ABC transporter permease, partial [Gemmataceae bacterium]